MNYFPDGYKPILDKSQTDGAIKFIKDTFERELSGELKLSRATAPLFVPVGSGINDDLSGVEKSVRFKAKGLGGQELEIVHSLAKWKRLALSEGDFEPGRGIYTDMNAVRADDTVDPIHSVYVDQWDWERVIGRGDYNLDFLKGVVRKIYSSLKRTEFLVHEQYSQLSFRFSREIEFIHSEDALEAYPDLSPEERERKLCEKFGSVFIIGIGGALKDGKPHGMRSPDYDNWSEDTGGGHRGLNGDLIVWDDIRGDSMELMSMGIRVDEKALMRQLEIQGKLEKAKLYWHRKLLAGEFPLTVGGGLGQSRLCMFLLHKAHIAEVQSSVWQPEAVREALSHGVKL